MSAGEVVQAYHLLSRAVRLMLAATFAAQVCLTVAGFEAVCLIWDFFAKRFTIADAEATAAALAFLSLGLPGWSAQTLISRGFYTLGSTWPPTLSGTAIAVAVIPLYVSLREVVGEYGLAIASALAVTIYVLSLGALQRLRFEREAAARALTLAVEPGMLDGAVRLGCRRHSDRSHAHGARLAFAAVAGRRSL